MAYAKKGGGKKGGQLHRMKKTQRTIKFPRNPAPPDATAVKPKSSKNQRRM